MPWVKFLKIKTHENLVYFDSYETAKLQATNRILFSH